LGVRGQKKVEKDGGKEENGEGSISLRGSFRHVSRGGAFSWGFGGGEGKRGGKARTFIKRCRRKEIARLWRVIPLGKGGLKKATERASFIHMWGKD